jgi:NAD dependent epimerase/dehydratase family enzyme
LKVALGELSSILLEGSRASNERLLATGFRFEHPELEAALSDLLRQQQS